MSLRGRRNTAVATYDQEETPVSVDTATDNWTSESDTQVTSEPTPVAETEKPKQVRRPIDVGDVEIVQSSSDDFPARPTKLDSNPVSLAVRDAEPGKAYDIKAANDKAKGVESILRRAASHWNVGINIAKPYIDLGDGHVLVKFKTRLTKRVINRKPKDEVLATSTPENS